MIYDPLFPGGAHVHHHLAGIAGFAVPFHPFHTVHSTRQYHPAAATRPYSFPGDSAGDPAPDPTQPALKIRQVHSKLYVKQPAKYGKPA